MQTVVGNLNKMTKTIKFLIVLLIICQACGQFDKKTNENIEKAVEHFNNEEYKKTIIYTNKLIRKDSSDYVSWTVKARALFNLGKEKEGINAINRAIEINPNYYEAYGYRAVMYNMTGSKDMNQIIQDLNIALSEEPDISELIKIKAGYLYKTGQFSKAINEYDKLLNLNPDDYEAIVLRAIIYKKAGKQILALKEYNRAINLSPKLLLAYEERAALFIEQEKYNKAISDYNKILEVLETLTATSYYEQLKAYTINNRGFAHLKLGDNKKSLIDINHSLELLPTNSYAYKNRALVYINKNNKKKACIDLQKAIELGYTEQYGNEVKILIKENCK